MGELRGKELELESREGKRKAEKKRLGLIVTDNSCDNVLAGSRAANTCLWEVLIA